MIRWNCFIENNIFHFICFFMSRHCSRKSAISRKVEKNQPPRKRNWGFKIKFSIFWDTHNAFSCRLLPEIFHLRFIFHVLFIFLFIRSSIVSYSSFIHIYFNYLYTYAYFSVCVFLIFLSVCIYVCILLNVLVFVICLIFVSAQVISLYFPL